VRCPACCVPLRLRTPGDEIVCACACACACLLLSAARCVLTGGVTDVVQVLGSIPANINGLALGTVSLGVTWQTAAEILEFPPALKLWTDLISLLTLNIAGSLVLLYLCKVVVAPAALKRDLEMPDTAAILCTLDMTLMSMSWVLSRHGVHSTGLVIWGVAVTMHAAILAMFSFHLLPRAPSPGFPWQAFQPAWMIPPIGICMASGTGRALGMGPWVEVFFYIGLLAFVFLLPAAIYRVHFWKDPLPEHLQPTIAIIAAPCALLLCQWVAIGGNERHSITHALFVGELLCVGFVARHVPTFLRLPLSRHHAAFTFPADISTKGVMIYSSLFLETSGLSLLRLCLAPIWRCLLQALAALCAHCVFGLDQRERARESERESESAREKERERERESFIRPV
jgi:exfoliative toxin A/B